MLSPDLWSPRWVTMIASAPILRAGRTMIRQQKAFRVEFGFKETP